MNWSQKKSLKIKKFYWKNVFVIFLSEIKIVVDLVIFCTLHCCIKSLSTISKYPSTVVLDTFDWSPNFWRGGLGVGIGKWCRNIITLFRSSFFRSTLPNAFHFFRVKIFYFFFFFFFLNFKDYFPPNTRPALTRAKNQIKF